MENIKLSFGGGGSGGASLPLPHTHNSTIVEQTRITGVYLNAWILAVG